MIGVVIIGLGLLSTLLVIQLASHDKLEDNTIQADLEALKAMYHENATTQNTTKNEPYPTQAPSATNQAQLH